MILQEIVASRIDFQFLKRLFFADEATEPNFSKLVNNGDDGCALSSSVRCSVIRDAQTVASNSKNLRDPG